MLNLAPLIAQHAADHALSDAAEWVRSNAQLVNACLDFPPPPGRGNTYTRADLTRMKDWLPEVPELARVRLEGERFKALMTQRGHAWAFDNGLHEPEDKRSLWPSRRFKDWLLHDEMDYELPSRFARAREPGPKWLRDYYETRLLPWARAEMHFMDVLSDEAWWTTARTPEDVLREMASAEAPSALRQVAQKILRHVHGMRLGEGGVPGFEAVATGGMLPLVAQAQTILEAREAKARTQSRRELLSAWAHIADVADNVGQPLSVERMNARFELTGARPPHVGVSQVGRGAGWEGTWITRVTGVLPGVTLVGPPSTASEADALAALHQHARNLRALPASSIDLPAREWEALLSSKRRAVGEGFVDNPARTYAPGLPPGLLDLAERAGLTSVATWARVREGELGALMSGASAWTTTYPSGWRTGVGPADPREYPTEQVTRVDEGMLDPHELLGVTVEHDDLTRAGPPGFEYWPERSSVRADEAAPALSFAYVIQDEGGTVKLHVWPLQEHDQAEAFKATLRSGPKRLGHGAARIAAERGLDGEVTALAEKWNRDHPRLRIEGNQVLIHPMKAAEPGWGGTTGGRDRAEWQALVRAIRAHGRPEAPVVVRRALGGRILLLDEGASYVRASIEAELGSIPVRVEYIGGSERYGSIVDPATGAWQPFPAGRLLKVWQSGAWRSATSAGQQASGLPEHARLVRVLGGWSVSERQAALADAPLLVDVLPIERRTNPERRVLATLEDGFVAVRRRSGKVNERLPTVHLDHARLVLDEHGRVEGVEGVVGGEEAPAPLGGWIVVQQLGPGRVLADRATLGDPGGASVFLTARAQGRAGQLLARPMPVRVNAGEAEVVIDSEGRKYPATYRVIEAAITGDGLVMVSHRPHDLNLWTPGYPPEFQTRDLGAFSEAQKIRTIARTLDPVRLLKPNIDPTAGPPVVWAGPEGRFYALGGNGRTIALLVAPEERYADYERMARDLYPCWPAREARPGHRWIVVRVVDGITQAEAAQLAAASQLSSAAEEGRIGRALGLVRSLQLDISALPTIEWTAPISADNVEQFAKDNPSFFRKVLEQMDPAKRASYLQDTGERLAPLMSAVMLGFLPEEVRRPGLLQDPKVEDALMGALPALVTITSHVRAGDYHAQYDLLPELPAAFDVFQYLRRNRLTFSRLNDIVDAERRTIPIAGVQRLSDTSQLGFALAGVLHSAARRTAPEDAASEMLTGYQHAVREQKVRQVHMFGGPQYDPPDAAKLLASQIKGFELPGEKVQRGLFSNPGPPRKAKALIFDRSRFPAPSAARDWCKANGYHPGVPRPHALGWCIEYTPGGVNQHPVEAGVAALT